MSGQRMSEPEQKYVKPRELLEHLYLLGQLKPGKTINVKKISLIDHTRFNSWYRWWNDEDRDKSIDWIFTLIDQTRLALAKTDEDDRRAILLALKNAKDGIGTLTITYNDDDLIIARVNTALTEIHTLITKYEGLYIPIWLRQPLVKAKINPAPEIKIQEALD